MRFCIVAGEASGDILGADLINELKKYYPDATFEGIAGPRMQAAGCRSLFPMETLSVMGVFDVVMHLPAILSVHRRLVRHIKKSPPTVYIGIDAPDTNLRIAKKIRSTGAKVVHYVSPSVWAWRQNRVKSIAKNIDLMLTLFPFEADFYHKNNVRTRYVGHVMADNIPLQPDQKQARNELGLPCDSPILAILPGSRKSEIARHAPIFLHTAQACFAQLPNLQFVVPMANAMRAKQFEALWQEIAPELPIHVLLQNSGLALTAADTALTVSGTATLEAMLYKRNMVVCYKMSAPNFAIATRFIQFRYMALPNLLANKRLVPEFVQDDVHPDNLVRHVLFQLTQPQAFLPVYEEFCEIHRTLKQGASVVAAGEICELLRD
ncbi:MAG: lipid-A-disaccharide synthase [Gammaproteobacteria bacterium]|nr:lipid-A-disaccharide synthase [Gammaproteobacteria bacterium]